MAQWLLILSDSGLPLLSRSSSPHLSSLPFATTGLLSALHSSTTSHQLPLSFLSTRDVRLSFIQFGHVVLVFASHQTIRSSSSSHRLLYHILDGIVLLIGRAALEEQKAIERLKRKLRTCNTLVSSYITPTSDAVTLQLGVGLPEYAQRPPASSPFSHTLDTLLTSLSTACSTQHVALYHHHRLLLPSSHYALLHPSDLLSISMLLLSLPSPFSFSLLDQPIFLSHSTVHRQSVSGSTAYRLLHQKLSPTLSAVLLCGPSPDREGAERAIDGVWERDQGGLAGWDGSEREEEDDEDERVTMWMWVIKGKKVMTSYKKKRSEEPVEGGEEGREEVGESGSQERSGSHAPTPLAQLLAFYHSTIDGLMQNDVTESYMLVEEGQMWVVGCGDHSLYMRVDGCTNLQEGRHLAQACLSKLTARRKQRGSVLPVPIALMS